MDFFSNSIFMTGESALLTVISAAVVFLICLIAIKLISKLIAKILQKSRLEMGLKSFISSAVRIALWVLVIIIVADSLGIPTTSLVAVLSVAGLALSLSIQDIMANLFSGVTVLAAKPFVTGDYVEIGGVSGTIHAIGLFHTTVTTGDNKLIYMPNSKVTGSDVINYTHEPLRRVDITVNVAYGTTNERMKATVLELVEKNELILSDPAPFVGLLNLKESTVEYVIRAWTKKESYWDVYFSLNESLAPALQAAGIELTYPRFTVKIDKD